MRTSILAITGALAFGAIACGTPAQQGGPAAPAGGTSPKAGGTINLQVPIDPFDWDLSYVGKSSPNGNGQAFAYESLLGFKTGPDIKNTDLIMRPELAEKWEVSADAKTYTFHLRPGLKFANLPPVNGRDLTSADVKFSFEYWSRTGAIKDKKLPQGQFDYMFEGMESLETPDARTVVVKFKDSFVPFLNYAASDYNPVVAREIYEADGHFKDKIVGSGPYQLDAASSQKGTRWVWKKNPTYWDAGKPYIDEARWLVIPDASSAIAGFRTRQLDHLADQILSHRQVEDLKKSYPQAVILEGTGYGGHIYIQTAKAPFNDERVRRAFSMAIDRDELSRIDVGTKAQWTPAGAVLGLFTDEEARQMLKFDLNEAKRLLTEAGHPNGVSATWEFPGKAYGESYVTLLELIQSQVKKAGINITLKSIDKDEFSTQRKLQNYGINMTPAPCGGNTDDPEQVLFGCYHSKSKANYGAVNDPDIDRLLLQQRGEPDPAKRRELLRNLVRRVVEKSWATELYYPPQWEAVQPYVKGYAPNLGAKGWDLTNVWLDK